MNSPKFRLPVTTKKGSTEKKNQPAQAIKANEENQGAEEKGTEADRMKKAADNGQVPKKCK